ncbi:hypothetical protein VTO73DRAFT_209 [Trametes versicolor]
MNVMNSPLDLRSRDDHVRLLLDQRAARADLHGHGRFPSLSEFSDSPSVYSHPHFSPRPSDRAPHDGGQPFRFPQSSHPYSPSLAEPRSPISDRERLNIPTASSLDLEDDPRLSSDYGSMHDGDDSSPEEDGEEEVPRINMYGPKMRFHSPAPWEEDEEELSRDSLDEPSKRSKKKGESGKKGWGLSRGTSEPRPSNDSSTSSRPKQSFETSSTLSAAGALAALAQASMSSTSLAINPSPQSLRDKLSLPRLRSRTPSSGGHVDAHSNNASPISRMTSPADADADDRSFGYSSTRSATPQHMEYTHPYANPDLVRVATHDLPLASPNFQTTFGANRGDSNATLTDTTTHSSSMSQFRSTTTLSITPGTSTTSVSPSLNDSVSSTTKVGGKGISGPMPVDKSSLPMSALSMLNGVPGSPIVASTPLSPARTRENTLSAVPMGGLPAWHESSGGGGALKLISLEEAQAQARERSRTAQPAISSPYASTSKTQLPDPDSDGSQRVQGRARSTSAGASKGRHPLPMSGDSSPGGQHGGPHRQVARKKSGFMRLFNGKDRDRVSPGSPPPPVPSLSNDAFAANPQQPMPPPQYSRPRQGSATHRVPVPSLSPSTLGDSAANSGSSIGSGSSNESSPAQTALPPATATAMREQQLSARRKVPDLSIVTSSPPMGGLTAKVPYTAPLSAGAHDMSHHLTPTMSHADKAKIGAFPSSAPPCKTDFVGLSIRPVSTLFSRELKEQLSVADDASLRTRPSLEVDTGTPTTAATAISPLSPDFHPHGKYGRASDEKSGPMIAQDDQSSVIQALQEQILTARRAWQRQIWELEGQVRDLKAEVEELRAVEGSADYCASCGRGGGGGRRPGGDDGRNVEELRRAGVKTGVVNRPRARTGVGSRFASGT